MARAIWKGSISFGLVNIPVGLYTAEKANELSFDLLDSRDKAHIRYKRVNEQTGKEVPWEQIVRGYEYEDGRYIVVSDEDLKRANPEATQTIDIIDFVDIGEVSPLYFEKPYFLGPDKKGLKSYALLREVLKRTGKVGIATVVIRTRQRLAAVIPQDKVLVLEILRYANELRDAGDLDLPAGKEGVTDRELDMAERLVEGMVDTWKPEQFHDTYRDDVLAMIKRRVKAGQIESPPPSPEEEEERPARGQVIDLMALLKQSVDHGGRKSGGAKKKAAPAKKSAAKKPARKPARAAKKTASKRKSA
ncbi:MAG TPA: Ku protein [Thermoanaerobaculia bacterium]|nr:Ku protein [Thermoanaerobaculia bacterium]